MTITRPKFSIVPCVTTLESPPIADHAKRHGMIPRARGLLPRNAIKVLLPRTRPRISPVFPARHFANDSSPPPEDHRAEPLNFPQYNKKTYGADVKKFSQLPLHFGANQHISIDDTLKENLRAVLWKFNAPIRYAFAYGSGVFQQANQDETKVNSLPCAFGFGLVRC
jgi:Phosphatidate cytidylyltransferase, mitochondrial